MTGGDCEYSNFSAMACRPARLGRLAPANLAQNEDFVLTEHGHPDLQGIYTYRTLTPLNRPAELADREVLTEAEATEWEAY